MNPRLDFDGHEPDYRHFRTDRHSGLLPHHFERKKRHPAFELLLGVCIIAGCASLAVFLVQVLR